MDEDTIIIQIEIRKMAETIAAIKKIARQVALIGNAVRGHTAEVNQLNMAYKALGSSVAQIQRFNGGSSSHVSWTQSISLTTQTVYLLAKNVIGGGAHASASASASVHATIGKVGNSLLDTVAKLFLLDRAVDSLKDATVGAGMAFRNLGLTSGGNLGETARLSVYGHGLGVDMGQMARQFADLISHGGTAGGFAARAGIHDYGIFDTTDKAKKLLAWMKYLDTLSPQSALQAARATGTEGLLGYRGLSNRTKNALDRDSDVKQRIFDPEFLRNVNELSFGFARFTDALSNLATAVLKPFMPSLVKIFNDLADWLNKMAIWANSHQNLIKGVGEIILGILDSFFGQPMKGMDSIKQGVKDIKTPDVFDPLRDAIERNTAATDTNTGALAQNGTYGGGERARGAIPRHWGGMNTERYVSEASRLGAFAL